MSKRYGRNQRRQHREREAQLQQFHSYATERYREAEQDLRLTKRALFEATGGWYGLATGKELLVIDEANVASFTDTTDGDRGRVERTARVTLKSLRVTDELVAQLQKRFRGDGAVAWRGLSWFIANLEAQRPVDFRDGPGIWDVIGTVGEYQYTLELRAVRGTPNPLERWAR